MLTPTLPYTVRASEGMPLTRRPSNWDHLVKVSLGDGEPKPEQVTQRQPVGIVDLVPPNLRQIAGAFVRYANATFGGGSATTAVLHRAIVDERAWVAPERFALIYALARLTPGTNLLALCTGLGWQLCGWRGALIALLAASVPCSAIVVVVTYFFEQWSHNRLAEISRRGAVAAAVGITVVTCWTIFKPYFKSRHWPRAALIGATAFALAAFLGIQPIRILLAAGVVGLLWPVRPA